MTTRVTFVINEFGKIPYFEANDVQSEVHDLVRETAELFNAAFINEDLDYCLITDITSVDLWEAKEISDELESNLGSFGSGVDVIRE